MAIMFDPDSRETQHNKGDRQESEQSTTYREILKKLKGNKSRPHNLSHTDKHCSQRRARCGGQTQLLS